MSNHVSEAAEGLPNIKSHEDWWRFFRSEAFKMGIILDDRMMDQFRMFYEMLLEKNKVMNLTAITELGEVIEKHFLDSLSLVNVWIPDEESRIMDLGTGAGFPGIPLKIVFPETDFVLVDSLNKRLKFLDEFITKSGIKGIELVHGRAEDLGRIYQYREQFDTCVSRAVAPLTVLLEYCLPFVKVKGRFVSYKSISAGQEIVDSKKALSILGGKVLQCREFTLPGTDMKRSLIEVGKEKRTPTIYPRKPGLPVKEPLI